MYWNIPIIHIKKEDPPFRFPRELVWKDKKWMKHVSCPFARFHVISYGLRDEKAIMWCSEEDCIINAPDEIQKKLAEFHE